MSDLMKRLACLLAGHVGGGVYLGYDDKADAMRRCCLRCRKTFLEPSGPSGQRPTHPSQEKETGGQ